MVVPSKLARDPVIGLGMAALGRPGYINLDRSSILGHERSIETMQRRANLVLDSLFAISSPAWIDCARSYGLSEKFVGEYLRGNKISPDQAHVSSKWGYKYVADWKIELSEGEPHEVKDHSVEHFLKQVEETNEMVGEYVKLYQVHSATFESGILSNVQAQEALNQCRTERGWRIGLSVSGPNQADVIRAALTLKSGSCSNAALFDSVQCTFNLLEQSPGPALQEAHDAGMDVIIKEGMANGRVFRNTAIKKFADHLECDVDQLAMSCILAQPFRPRVLSGAVTPDQLASNFRSQNLVDRLQNDPELLANIMRSCVMPSEDYWNERSALAWN
jgi:aryl-alcohol dehydrogenase-like predicted oxidoreductase